MYEDLNLRKYIGHAYEDWNCLRVVQEFYRDHFNLEVRNYFDGQTIDRREVEALIETNRGDFFALAENAPKKFGDIISIKLYGIECHLGVLVDDGENFLHSAKGVGSCMERIRKYERLIAGYYRHRELLA